MDARVGHALIASEFEQLRSSGFVRDDPFPPLVEKAELVATMHVTPLTALGKQLRSALRVWLRA